MVNRILKICTLILCLTSTSLLAQKYSDDSKEKEVFEKFDLNHDKKFDLSEFSEMRAAALETQGIKARVDFSRRFNRIDMDSDGFITKKEFHLDQKKWKGNKNS